MAVQVPKKPSASVKDVINHDTSRRATGHLLVSEFSRTSKSLHEGDRSKSKQPM
jgi:hypothetical protein